MQQITNQIFRNARNQVRANTGKDTLMTQLFNKLDDVFGGGISYGGVTQFKGEGVKLTAEQATDLTKSYGTKQTQLQKQIEGMTDATKRKALEEQKSNAQTIFDSITKNSDGTMSLDGLDFDRSKWDIAKDYFTAGDAGGDLGVIGKRAGLVAGGAVGLRYLQGGNLTTNARGERDIAGIPFI